MYYDPKILVYQFIYTVRREAFDVGGAYSQSEVRLEPGGTN